VDYGTERRLGCRNEVVERDAADSGGGVEEPPLLGRRDVAGGEEIVNRHAASDRSKRGVEKARRLRPSSSR
jgi:hypothetical protein